MKKILTYIIASMFAVSMVAPVGITSAEAHGWCKNRTTAFCEKRKAKKLARQVKRGKVVIVKTAEGTTVAVPKSTLYGGRSGGGSQTTTVVTNVVTGGGGGRGGYGRGGGGRGDWGRGGGGRGGGGWGRGPGIGDVAGGIIIGSAVSNWLFPPKPEVVVVEAPPPPRPEGPPAWSPEWYDYCNGKYKSFDAKTGYYTGYDGQQHFCQ